MQEFNQRRQGKALFLALFFGLCAICVLSTMSTKVLASQNDEFKALIEQIKKQHEPFYNAQHATLSNGMKVIVIPNDRAPVLTHMVWYKVGGADEPVGLSGTAHFLEHLLFKGTATQEPGEFSKIVRNMGGRDNAFTSWDYTAYFQTIPSEHLEKVMTFEADRMRGANPPEEHFLSERKVILEERRQTLENNPAARLFEQMRHALFVNHPYGRPIIGWMHEMEALDWAEIKRFYDRWYSPSNATLIVAGDVVPQDLFDMAERIYGKINAFEVPQNNRPNLAPFDTAKEIVQRDPLVKQRSFTRMTVTHNAASKPLDALKMALIGTILDGGATSRLYKSLVVDQKKAVGVYFSYNGFMRGAGTLSYGATPVDDVSFNELERAMLEEFKKAASEGFTQEELDRAKNRIIDSQIFELDSITGPAMVFGHTLMAGLEPDYLEYWTHVLEKITLEDINEKAAESLPQTIGLFSDKNNKNDPWARSVYGYLLPQNFVSEDDVSFKDKGVAND